MAATYVLKKVPYWPAIRTAFLVFIIIGIVIGVFYAVLLSTWGVFMSSFAGSSLSGEFGLLRNLGFVLIPVVAILYAIFGTIVVAIGTLIYNLIASAVGGVELVLEPAGRNVAASPQPSGTGESAHVPPDKTITGF
ncbi:MAG TPA: DUF3566 domain-containing protein [Candidatus Bathyarchaeia archaeon]|nr:DUF3566 domain-containing protein [Candidatus Bathyarchaeia archaeon]